LSNRHLLPLPLRLSMLASVIDFMSRSGMVESTIRKAFEDSMASLDGSRSDQLVQRREALGIGNENLSAELLRIWHRDGRYIDRDAKPRPLALAKGRNNLRATIRRIGPDADAAAILREMKAARLIRRTSSGRYLPTSESAIVSQLHPMAIDHIAKLVIRLVSTVSRNVDPAERSLSLIERHAYAPNLSWTERKAFAEFTRSRGMAFLESVDDWLEQRRVGRTARDAHRNDAGIPASVHLFAHLGDGDVGSVNRRRRVENRSAAVSKKKAGKARARPATSPRGARA
jgi:hypothetical protein